MPEDNDEYADNDEDRVWIVHRDREIWFASWEIARLIFGEDDGGSWRDEVELAIQTLLSRVFNGVEQERRTGLQLVTIDGVNNGWIAETRRSLGLDEPAGA